MLLPVTLPNNQVAWINPEAIELVRPRQAHENEGARTILQFSSGLHLAIQEAPDAVFKLLGKGRLT